MLILENQNAPCSALEYRNGKHWCGLAINPENYSQAIASMSNSEISKAKEWIGLMVGIGLGADNCKIHVS